LVRDRKEMSEKRMSKNKKEVWRYPKTTRSKNKKKPLASYWNMKDWGENFTQIGVF
jgi:hypothetical protein